MSADDFRTRSPSASNRRQAIVAGAAALLASGALASLLLASARWPGSPTGSVDDTDTRTVRRHSAIETPACEPAGPQLAAREPADEDGSDVPVDFGEVGLVLPHWETPRTSLVPSAQRETVRGLVERAIEKYRPLPLRRYVRRIVVLGDLQVGGLPLGGTYDCRTATVYVVAKKADPGLWLERCVHAEISSLILRAHPGLLDAAEWRGLNATRDTYGRGGFAAIRDGRASTRWTWDLLELGFLGEYGRASEEEDFNEFASELFTGRPEFWTAVETHARVRRKARLAISFYQALSPSLYEGVFRQFYPVVAQPLPDSTGTRSKY